MGGYDGQTFAGVMSTATHGTGVSYGPLASFARSIDLVAAGGIVHRIEPAGGITDAEYARAQALAEGWDRLRPTRREPPARASLPPNRGGRGSG